MNQELVNPVGSKYVYSDLSMITMMFVLGRLAQNLNYIHSEELNPLCVAGGKIGIEQCYYEAYVKKYIIDYVGMQDSFFNLSPENMKRAAPTPWTFLEYRDNAQGQVQDDNAYAMGGVSGHAGLFSTASDAFKLLQKLVFASNNDPWINSSTVHYFTTMRNSSQSARALGWDTNDYTARGYGGCGNLSPRTFMHTGYAGTQVCCDPDRKLIVVLLTNSNGTNSEMLNARRDFSDQVLKLWESK
jgi:CubicO group peptidase (beta-lactamase class C family)